MSKPKKNSGRATIKRARGFLRRKLGEKPFGQSWAEYKKEEKALEEEYPGIGFRDSVGGREAYVQGHRVAVWEVVEVHREAKAIAKTADHFRWTPALVRCALAYAKAFAKEMVQQHNAEVGV